MLGTQNATYLCNPGWGAISSFARDEQRIAIAISKNAITRTTRIASDSLQEWQEMDLSFEPFSEKCGESFDFWK